MDIGSAHNLANSSNKVVDAIRYDLSSASAILSHRQIRLYKFGLPLEFPIGSESLAVQGQSSRQHRLASYQHYRDVPPVAQSWPTSASE